MKGYMVGLWNEIKVEWILYFQNRTAVLFDFASYVILYLFFVFMKTGSSLPAGILQGIHYERRSVRLREGDLIVMMSDGALSIAPDWLKEELALAAGEPVDKIAQRLANLSKRNERGRGDDITVMAARIVRA